MILRYFYGIFYGFIFNKFCLYNLGFAVAVEDATEDEMDAGDPEATATTDEETESKVNINSNCVS